MAVNTRSVSLFADQEYHNALSALAHKQGKSLGLLVREALDAQYGSDLEDIVLFFRKGDAKINHSMQNKSKRRAKGKQS